MNPSPSSLSPSSFSKRKRDPNSLDKSIKHDFFLNYSDDIRNGFISHVKGAFDRNGFTISDHTELPVGQSVRSELLKAIEGSQIFVIVFSINYGFSVRCLDELVNIMLCFGKSVEKKLLPVFFNVDPSDVRNQEGPFKEAFKAHNTNFDGPRVQKWRRALNDVGQLSGAHYQNGDEESFICKMVQKLQSMHNPPIQYERNCLVGIESREEELISSLRLDSNDPSIVAVLGISGIGKTTIANAVFNKIAAKFDVSCFLEVIHYDFENPDLMLKMQKKLIHRLSQNDKLPMIHNHFEGAAKIKMLLRGRKVLLVLDDLDNVKQWEAFGIDDPYNTISLNECLGDGSRIIVTTRDIQSLGSLPYVSYNTSLLNITESIELLTQLIYEEGEPIDMNFVEEIASCASGLPLVIEVWSRYFRSLERKQWPDALKRLKKIPHDDVHKKLKISYNSLSNRAKKLFLDIACVFDGMDLKLIVKVLQDNNEDMAFFWDQEIRCLAHKGLVIISSRLHTRVLMHHAIREMGQEIVRQENEDEPGQRTRLTNHKDVLRVLKDFSGTQSVESIHQGHMTGHIDAFRNMNNLRLIRLDDVALCSVPRIPFGCDCEDMSPLSFPMLKYLEWVVFPLESINIDMCNVVVVRLPHSRLEALWKEPKCLEKLKILDVGDSLLLTKPGNFNGLKNLEYLHFNGCKNLEELDSSLWCLDKLVILDLHCCSRLKRFPSKMEGKLRSLQVLDLSECVSIGFEYDEVIKHFMSSLKETHITRLMLSGCNIYKVPSEVGSLTWLKHLDLGLNYFHSLPDSLVKVDQLETIDLSDCYSLQSIPYLPRSICSVIARNCGCLTSLPLNMAELTSLEELHLRGCSKLGIEDPDCLLKLTGLTSLTILKMAKCNVSQVPNEIGNLVSLHTLNLSENTFSSFPDSFGNLLQLRELSIWNCSNLTSLPLLPPLLTKIEATGCLSLDVMRSASVVIDDYWRCPTPALDMTYPYKFSKCVLAAYRESSFLSRLQIELSEEEFPIWCYNVFWREFMAPQHLDRKICGIILCLKTRSAYDYVGANLQNKTKGTSYHLTRHGSYFSRMCIMFFPLDNTTLVVDAGDWLALDFQENDNNDQCFSGFGVCLIYKGDVMEPTANNVHQTTGFSGIRSVPGDDVYKLLIEDRPYDYQEDDDDDDSDSDENLHESQRTDDADYHPFFEPYHVGLTHNNL